MSGRVCAIFGRTSTTPGTSVRPPKNVHGSFPNSSWTLVPQRLHVSLKKMRNLIQRDKHLGYYWKRDWAPSNNGIEEKQKGVTLNHTPRGERVGIPARLSYRPGARSVAPRPEGSLWRRQKLEQSARNCIGLFLRHPMP